MTDPIPAAPAPSKGVSPALIVLIALPLIGIAAALGLLFSNTPAQPSGSATAVVGRVGSLDKPVPDFLLTTLEGAPSGLDQYRGRPVFLNFWGTWCAPCIEELPELQAFAAAQGENGAVVVSSNNTETPDTIYRYFADNDLALPDVHFVLDEPDSSMYRWFGVYQMPTTYLIDADGIVRAVKYGKFDQAGMQAYLDTLAADQTGG